MKCLCICMSPALDATVTLRSWPTDGSISKDVEEVENVGGKGINVARWLAGRGCSVACGGLLGEDNAVLFERELRKYGIDDRFVRVPGATRRNEMIVTPQGSFKINRKAFPGLDASNFRFHVFDLGVDSGDVVVLSGSLPKCCDSGFYAEMTRELKSLGAVVVLDASGESLRQAVAGDGLVAYPDVIKPNAEECEPLVGFVPKTPEDFKKATALLNGKIPHVIISDGAAGCWFNGEFVAAPEIGVLDTTAAGDTLLAEWCYRTFACGEQQGFDRLEAAKWAVAAGSAACTMPGGDPPPRALVQSLHDAI